jgi:hypothetical protein
MGILDDAIREHLDLKRRRGADPADVERAEREALGPVRRRFEDQPDFPENGPAGEEEPLEEGVHEDWHEPFPEAPATSASAPEDFADLDAPSPARWEDEARLPPAEPPPPPRAADPPVHGLEEETSEYDVTRDHAPADEDVLEETPEFLQDTPDHDRLWFEQRPPRDFDFDG